MGRASEIFRLLIKNRAFSGMTPGNLCSLLEELGPFYIKLGQILAVGSGVLPEEYCRALSELRTDVTPMPYAQVREILEREYGRPPEEVFSEFRGEVLGSASVAQVHYARLKSGEEAAVKVQRPDTLRQFSRDLALFERLAPLVRLSPARKVVDFPQILGELREAARSETDLRREAENLSEFRAMLADTPEVTCPEVFSEYCTENVLVMEYIDGIRLDRREELLSAGVDTEALVRRLCVNYAWQMLEGRRFHADPHAGNVMLRGREIVWIDLGMTGRITGGQSRSLKKGIRAVVEQDPERIAEVLSEMSGSPCDKLRLTRAAADAMETFRRMPLREMDVTAFLGQFLTAARDCGVVMPRQVTMLTRGVVVLKGIIDGLAPNADLLSLLAAAIQNLNMRVI